MKGLEFVVEGQRKQGRQDKVWQIYVEEESMMVGLGSEDMFCPSKWTFDGN